MRVEPARHGRAAPRPASPRIATPGPRQRPLVAAGARPRRRRLLRQVEVGAAALAAPDVSDELKETLATAIDANLRGPRPPRRR